MNEIFDPSRLSHVTFSPENGCNVPDDVLTAQVAANIRRQLPQLHPHLENKESIALVCGGPSLALTEKELIERAWAGSKVVAVNGAYQWCIDRNIRPSAMVMLDARAFNARFLETPVVGCRYLLASQCHPDAFELCKDRDVTIWHACSGGQPELDMLNEFYFNNVFPATGGTTVAIRAVCLMYILGFRTFDIFGLDSCWMGEEHHSYAQEENEKDGQVEIWLRPRNRDDLAQRFICAPWMVQQSADFMNLIREQGNKFRINVRGNGLIATIMRLSALLGSEVKPIQTGE